MLRLVDKVYCSFIALVVCASFAAAQEPVSTQVSREFLQPFFQQHCIRCHGPKEQEGQVRFDQVLWEIKNNDSAQRWQDLLDILNAGDMPPEDEPQPEPEELAKVLNDLTKTLVVARRRLTDHGGEIAMRRLNRREYANTIRHLFGFELSMHMIPEDGEADSFDTVGAEQYFTSSHLKGISNLGEKLPHEASNGPGNLDHPRPSIVASKRNAPPRSFGKNWLISITRCE